MKRKRTPLTVVYLCSNAEIAEQNRRKLDPNSRKPVGRVTQLVVMRADEAEGPTVVLLHARHLAEGWDRPRLGAPPAHVPAPPHLRRHRMAREVEGVLQVCVRVATKWREETTRGALRQESRERRSAASEGTGRGVAQG